MEKGETEMRFEIDAKYKCVDYYIEDESGTEHHSGMYFDEAEKFAWKLLEEITKAKMKGGITNELAELCVDYDRHASEYARNIKGKFKHFAELNLARMCDLDVKLSKYEGVVS